MLTRVRFYNEEGAHIGTEHFTFGFTTNEVIERCIVLARVNETFVTAVRPDGFSCGMWGPDDHDLIGA